MHIYAESLGRRPLFPRVAQDVLLVTNLSDSGPGSFREACESGGPRMILFNVAGIIRLRERVRIRAPYITIWGSTAPGDGVCIAGNTIELETHDVVIRHMRFRRGETWVGERNDSIGGNPTGNIMIDHVSASWGLDENMSMYRHMHDHDGYPKCEGTPYEDSDCDGLPDAWETKHGLNPLDTASPTADADADGYTNVEEFMNGTDPIKFVDYTNPANNMDKPQ